MSDRFFALALLGVCALIVIQMWVLDVPFAYEPVGPKAFPVILALLMAACCVALLASPDGDIRWPETPLLGKGAALVAVLLGYAIFFETLGFPLATAVMVLAVSRVYGGRTIPGLLTGASIGVLGYLFFDRLLQVSLPIGRIWGQ
jgi:putative tricarboxylic transport membrane protein